MTPLNVSCERFTYRNVLGFKICWSLEKKKQIYFRLEEKNLNAETHQGVNRYCLKGSVHPDYKTLPTYSLIFCVQVLRYMSVGLSII